MDREEAAFIETICRDADNDAPRLIYADWLEETGDPVLEARGEFIRVQCELASLKSNGQRRRQLHERQKELFRLHRKAWIRHSVPEKLLPMTKSAIWAEPRQPGYISFGPYERGFPTELTINWDSFKEVTEPLSAFLRFGPFRRLHYDGSVKGVGKVFRNTPHVASLRKIWMQSDGQYEDPLFSPDNITLLWRSPHLVNLKELFLGSYKVGAAGVRPLARADGLRSLQVLELSGLKLGNAGVEEVLHFPHLRKVTKLKLSANGITGDGARMLAEAPELDGLATLDLQHNRIDQETTRVLRRRFGRRVKLGRWT